jgi:demethylspheroidene O-methyltransferase
MADSREFAFQIKGFILSKALMAALELNIFPLLESGGLPFEAINSRLGLDCNISRVFLDILEAFGYLKREGGRYTLTEQSRAILPNYANTKSWAEEMKWTYQSLDDFTEILKTGNYRQSALSAHWAYKKTAEPRDIEAEISGEYSAIMDTSQEAIANLIVDKIDFSAYSHLLDIGGGYGRFAITVAQRYPTIRATVVDLPSVCRETKKFIAREGLAERVTAVGADFFKDPLPEGADIISFVRTLHDWGDEEAARLLEIARSALGKDGAILIAEPMAQESPPSDPGSVLSSLMLALIGGKRRRVSEYTGLLKSLGFGNISCIDLNAAALKAILGKELKK